MIKLLEATQVIKNPEHKKCLVRLSKRYFFNGRDYYVDEEKREVRLDRLLHHKLETKTLWRKFGFRKIGGSMLGDILETDPYKSQFFAFLKICRLEIPIFDKTHINPGVSLEVRIREIAEIYYESLITFWDPKEHNFDIFPDNPISGGIPDGVIDDYGVVIEFKTTHIRNLRNWEIHGPPENYVKQAQYYALLLNLSYFVIMTVFLNPQDYKEPWTADLQNRAIRVWNFELDKEQAEDDQKYVEQWYIKHTKSGISPPWPRSIDKDVIDYLKCKNQEEWDILLFEWALAGKINFDSLIKEVKIAPSFADKTFIVRDDEDDD